MPMGRDRGILVERYDRQNLRELVNLGVCVILYVICECCCWHVLGSAGSARLLEDSRDCHLH